MPDGGVLSGLTIVVTRPADQAAVTARLLRDAGARVIEFPVLGIFPLDAIPSKNSLASAYAVIFVSANAVEHGVPVLKRGGELAAGCYIMAIGQATARALAAAGFEKVVTPDASSDSEGLLALPLLQEMKGKTVILVRGKSESGGRRLIEEVLGARDARVDVLECYERRTMRPEESVTDALRSEMKPGQGWVTMALSVETIDGFVDAMHAAGKALTSMPLLVPHARVAQAARERGFGNVFEIPVSDTGLVGQIGSLKKQLVTAE